MLELPLPPVDAGILCMHEKIKCLIRSGMMKHNKISRIIAVAGLLLLVVLCPNAGAAQASGGASPPYNTLILEPGHSQTLLFELDTPVSSKSKEVYACYVLTVGAGSLNVRVGTASSVGQSAGVVYALAGLVNANPVFKYAYNAETISYSVDVPSIGLGIFFAAIVRDTGSPDYPVVMSMVVSLI